MPRPGPCASSSLPGTCLAYDTYTVSPSTITLNGAYPFGSRGSLKNWFGRVRWVKVRSNTSTRPWPKFAASSSGPNGVVHSARPL